MAFKRLKRGDVLELETRNKIYLLISSCPGIHLRELERRSGIPYTTLKYHLHFLSRHQLITESKESGNILYFHRSIDFEDAKVLGLLRQKNIRRILVFLLNEKNAGLKEICDFVGLTQSTVFWYLKGLIGRGVILKIRKGNNVFYKLEYDEEKLMNVLITYRESFLDSIVDKVVEMWDV